MWFSSVCCQPFFLAWMHLLHFSCSFHRRWIIKATYWISKVCLWKTRLTRTGAEVEELPKILVTFFPQILFLPPTHSLWFFFLSRCFKRKGARSWEPNAWWTPYNGIFRNVRSPDYPVSSLKTKKWYRKYTVRLLSGFVFFLGSSTYMTTAASVLGDERMNECC